MVEAFSLLTDFTLRNVMLGAALLGIVSGVLGSFALLRQQSLLGDTLSHAALPGVALGFLVAGGRHLVPILLGALFTGALAALFMVLLVRRSRLKTDAALGAALSIFFAFGIVLLTYIGNQNNAGQAGLEAFLFGQAASIIPSDVATMAVIAALALGIVALFWKEFKVVSFDPEFAGSLGFPVLALELTMTVMVALAIVMGLQMVGVVLMASMIVAPAAAARQWSPRLEPMVLLAALFGALSGVTGAVLSATGRNLATGPLIVIVASVIVGVSLLLAPQRGLVWWALRNRRTRRQLQLQQILTDLYHLAVTHDDPHYPAELGMVDSYYGTSTRRLLGRLESQGYAERVTHMQEEGQHWSLTPKGYDAAQNVLKALGNPA